MNETVTKKTRVDLSGFQPHHRYQILRCNEAPKPILNAASSHDPARLASFYDATNVDVLRVDERAPENPVDARNYIQGDVRHLPFEPGEYRTVVYGELIEHCCVDAARDILCEGKRVVGKDGWIIVTVPADYGPRVPKIPLDGKRFSYAPGITAWHSTLWYTALLQELFLSVDLKPVHAEVIRYEWEPPARGFGLVLADIDCDVKEAYMDPTVGTDRFALIDWYVERLQPRRCVVTGCGSITRRNIGRWLALCPELDVYGFDLFEDMSMARSVKEQCVLPAYVCSLHQAQAEYPRVRFTKGNTQKTLESAMQRIIDHDGLIDFAFLGGGHSYETVLNEIIQVNEGMRQDGMVMVEDAGLQSVDEAVEATRGMIDWHQEEYHLWHGVVR